MELHGVDIRNLIGRILAVAGSSPAEAAVAKRRFFILCSNSNRCAETHPVGCQCYSSRAFAYAQDHMAIRRAAAEGYAAEQRKPVAYCQSYSPTHRTRSGRIES